MKKIDTQDPREKLTKARMQLLMAFPFFGELVMRMVFHESKTAGVGTTCVDHKGNMYYHPDWVKGFTSNQETMFELAHEVMHLVQRCTVRFPQGGDHRIWNIAADIKVDSILVDAGLTQSTVSKKNITDELMEKHRGKTTEQIYYHLIENPDEAEQYGGCPHKQSGPCEHKPPGQGDNDDGDGEGNQQGESQDSKENNEGEGQEDGNGGKAYQGDGQGPGGSCSQCPGDAGSAVGERGCTSGALHGEDSSSEDIEKWKQHVIAAALHAKGRGKMPAFADDFLAEIRKPSVTWKEYLRRQATSHFRGRYSFHRQNRRSRSIGMKLPSRTRSPNGAIIMIDTSGSISDDNLTQFVSECAGIMRETGCRFLKIYFHDVECYHIEEYDLNTISKIKATRGGTSHIDVFDKVNESDDKVGMVIAFTDLETSFPEKPDYPVFWAHPPGYEGHEVPFGTKIPIDLTA